MCCMNVTLKNAGPYLSYRPQETLAIGGGYCHGARGGSGTMSGIVGIAQDRAMYVGDYVAEQCMGAVPCWLSFVGIQIDQWVKSCVR